MENYLIIKELVKDFSLSRKQKLARNDNASTLRAVDHVSITLKPGEIYGLLGPNGAGKTTTLRMISSLIKPNSGEIVFNGTNIHKNINEYRKRIGFLTSELKLDEFFSADYTFDYMSRLYNVSEADIASRKKLLFDEFGITPFRYQKIKELSTGMKQKVSLAISLCHDPDIIIFDEPTNGLDIVASKDVEDFLTSLRLKNKIIIISTHIFSLVEKLCDRVGIIIDGKLVLDENMKALTEKKSLEDVFFDLYKRR